MMHQTTMEATRASIADVCKLYITNRPLVQPPYATKLRRVVAGLERFTGATVFADMLNEALRDAWLEMEGRTGITLPPD